MNDIKQNFVYNGLSLSPFPYFFSEYFINSPAFLNSPPQEFSTNIYISSPFTKMLSLPTKCYETVITFVPTLFSPGSPFAVLSVVVPIIIYPFNGGVFFAKFFHMGFIRLIHILSEALKICPKALYSSSSIMFIRTLFNRIATIFYTSKNLIKSSTTLTRFYVGSVFIHRYNLT